MLRPNSNSFQTAMCKSWPCFSILHHTVPVQLYFSGNGQPFEKSQDINWTFASPVINISYVTGRPMPCAAVQSILNVYATTTHFLSNWSSILVSFLVGLGFRREPVKSSGAVLYRLDELPFAQQCQSTDKSHVHCGPLRYLKQLFKSVHDHAIEDFSKETHFLQPTCHFNSALAIQR